MPLLALSDHGLGKNFCRLGGRTFCLFGKTFKKSLSILVFLSDHFLQISRCIVGPHVKKTIDSFAYGTLTLGFDDLRQAFLHTGLKA